VRPIIGELKAKKQAANDEIILASPAGPFNLGTLHENLESYFNIFERSPDSAHAVYATRILRGGVTRSLPLCYAWLLEALWRGSDSATVVPWGKPGG
jgi:hypothetical protein